jgi:hypothetical protein
VTVSGGLGESQTGGPTLNIVPRTGGNSFSGQLFGSTAGEWSQGNNIDDDLRALGFTDPPAIYSAWDTSGSIGGPIKRDRVWFFASARNYGSHTDILGRYGNLNAGNPADWTYVEDRGLKARNASSTSDFAGRAAAQVTPRNKVTFSFNYQPVCAGSSISGEGGCRSRGDDWVAAGGVAASPEASTPYNDGTQKITQGTWTSTVTSRLLLEAGGSTYTSRWGWMESPGSLTNFTPVTETSARYGIPNFVYRGLDNFFDNNYRTTSWRASASYVTGAHSLKVGYQGGHYIDNTEDFADSTGLTYTFTNGAPVSFGWRIAPWQTSSRTQFYALYAQDQWTMGRMTVQGAVRFDHAWSGFPSDHNGAPQAGPFNPAPITFPDTEGVRGYNDITPRAGLAYDVFGNGRTALKVNIGKYLQASVNQTQYVIANPALDGRNGRGGPRFVTNTSRAWTDSNGNFLPDCTILNPLPQDNSASGGDVCGPWLNPNFGNAARATVVNPEVLEGWNTRSYDWQFGVSIQQELMPRVALEVGYNRRWWGNFFVTDNRAVGPSDYVPYTVTAPAHPELPDGGGYSFTALLPTNLAQDNFYTFSSDYGDETRLERQLAGRELPDSQFGDSGPRGTAAGWRIHHRQHQREPRAHGRDLPDAGPDGRHAVREDPPLRRGEDRRRDGSLQPVQREHADGLQPDVPEHGEQSLAAPDADRRRAVRPVQCDGRLLRRADNRDRRDGVNAKIAEEQRSQGRCRCAGRRPATHRQ